MSKGDWRRPAAVDPDEFRRRYDRVFGSDGSEKLNPRRMLQAIQGGAIIPLERLEEQHGHIERPSLVKELEWAGMPAEVIEYDHDRRVFRVKWKVSNPAETA